MAREKLPDGLYDLPISVSLANVLEGLPNSSKTVEGLVDTDRAERLAEVLARQLVLALDDVKGEGDEKALRQVELVNAMLVLLRTRVADSDLTIDEISEPGRRLCAVHRIRNPSAPPATGLAVPWLFTAGKGSPALLSELRHEISSCNRVDVLVSFITLSGVRKLLDLLQIITAVGANGLPRTRVRVLTTTYIGATEAAALDLLAQLPSSEVKVSLDGRRTRLHAKAWIFHRDTGFGSAYVGSANLSGAALLGGLEWTVKFTQRGQEQLFERAKAHFETLWNDAEFQTYNASDPNHRAALRQALARESGSDLIASPTFFDIEPKTYQREMLEALALERELGRQRNLIVAATGTGKTVVAAFDYRRTCHDVGGKPRLLFVAHREEILRQALRTYREVLRDHTFGELLTGGNDPASHEHVFGTIDSVASRSLVTRFGVDYWHVVVIDECHRLAAKRFHELATTIRPKILLGLTATPERSDGEPILRYFENRPDGSPAVELRLWTALEAQLLSAFEYFGCDDDTDFSEVPWDRPAEAVAAIDRVVTGNDVRARLVIDEWRRLTGDPRQSRALVFCVSVAHAEFMTKRFNESGLPAQCVVGATGADERRRAPLLLDEGKICALVTCDLYNEGIDLPYVDTLLLLRPTQSPVLFQQQIGRGLRLHPGKDSCLVLDFVGRHRTEFRFDRLLSTITGLSRNELIESVQSEFSRLPPGCHIHLGRVTRDQVLQSLRATARLNWRRLSAELQAFAALRGRTNIRLADFLREQAIGLDELYRDRAPSGWTALQREAGLLDSPPQPEDEYFGRRYSDLLHIDDSEQLKLMQRVCQDDGDYSVLSEPEKLRVQMLTYQIDAQHNQIGSAARFLDRLNHSSELRDELGQLGAVLASHVSLRFKPVPGLEDAPLCLHGSYRIRELLTAVGRLTSERRSPFQAGVLAIPAKKIELLFVTLDKSEGFHQSIAYQDYAISAELFHWQSQNSASPETVAGRRYIESPGNGWTFQLFVRATKADPYRVCGRVRIENCEGARPMSIVWKLDVPLPVRLFQEFSVLRGE